MYFKDELYLHNPTVNSHKKTKSNRVMTLQKLPSSITEATSWHLWPTGLQFETVCKSLISHNLCTEPKLIMASVLDSMLSSPKVKVNILQW